MSNTTAETIKAYRDSAEREGLKSAAYQIAADTIAHNLELMGYHDAETPWPAEAIGVDAEVLAASALAEAYDAMVAKADHHEKWSLKWTAEADTAIRILDTNIESGR